MQFWNASDFTQTENPIEYLVLFDVDGTLVFSGVVHRNSFQAALKELFGLDIEIEWTKYFGWTDPWILSNVLQEAGIDQETIDQNLDAILEYMGNYYAEHTGEEEGEVLPGVPELLTELRNRNILCGLVTGNVEKIAYYKLTYYGLAEYFALGGFGSDDSVRSRLILKAIEKAEQQFNFHYTGQNVIYVADTVHDVTAAHDAGLPIIIVRQWRNRDENFSEVEPELILDSMEDQQNFFKFLIEKGAPQ